jgi:hypothetical protein
MLRQAAYFLLSVIVLLGILVSVERTSSPFFQTCISDQQQAETDASSKNKPPGYNTVFTSYIACSGRFIEGHGIGITALATIVIAAFTATLWIATRQQGDLTFESLKLAREEFIASHRPRIELHSLKISHRSDETEPAPIEFRYVNSGDSVGHVKQVGTRLVYQREDMLQSDLDFDVREISPPMKIKSGEFGFGLTRDKSIPDLILSTPVSVTDYIKFFCVAYIVYTDDLGTIRQTGFCRRYDPETDRWVNVEDPEYEYSY